MNYAPELLLVAAVAGVGILHTMVPDHWVPITLIARQRGWSRAEVARAALGAGTGHVLSTLLIGLVVWLAGVAVATRFGNLVSTASSIALIAFGGWIGVSAWLELHEHAGHGHSHAHDFERLHGHSHDDDQHAHVHPHDSGSIHAHPHDHNPDASHPLTADIEADPQLHTHAHKTSSRTALLLILGSSPMVEGIPLLTAGKYGPVLIAVMSVVFAISTIATYVLLCVYSTARLQRVRLGALEQYGEVLSGAFIALVGCVFLIWPLL